MPENTIFNINDKNEISEVKWFNIDEIYKEVNNKIRKEILDSQNYKIIQTTSSTYTTDISKWKVTFTPLLNKIDAIVDDPDDDLDISSDSETDPINEKQEQQTKSKAGVCLLKFKK